jgi:hypothetical protein
VISAAAIRDRLGRDQAQTTWLGALAGAMVLAAWPWRRAYATAGAEPLLVAAVLIPLALTVVGRARAGGAAVRYAASALGLALCLLIMSQLDLGGLGHALVRGPAWLVHETLPLGGSAVIVAPVFALTWIVTALAGELGLGRGRAGLALSAPVALFVVGQAAVAGAPGQDAGSAAGLLALLALGAAARRAMVDTGPGIVVQATPRSRRVGARRGAGVAVVVAAGVIAAGLGAGQLSAHRPPAVLSAKPATNVGLTLDPVGDAAARRTGAYGAPGATILTVALDGAAPPYLQTAVLGQYNGDQWSFSTSFAPTGGRIPGSQASSPGPVAGLGSASRPQPVSVRIQVQRGLDQPFVPVLARPEFVRGLAVAADPASGMVVVDQGNLGRSAYTAVSRAPTATLSGLPPADGLAPPASPGADLAIPAGAMPDIKVALNYLASVTGQPAKPSVAFLQAVSAALQGDDRRVDPLLARAGATPTAVGGTSLAEVIDAVTVERAATPEQFATFMAVMARALGVPAQVVTGYKLASGGARPSAPAPGTRARGEVPAGTYQVTNADAWTWAEVPVSGEGWVVLDATPAAVTAPGVLPPEQVSASPTTVPPKQANALPAPSQAGHAVAPPVHIRVPRPGHTSLLARVEAVVVVLAGALALAVTLALLIPAGRRSFRRRSRRRGQAPDRAVGSWLELLDGFARIGLPSGVDDTAQEVAAAAHPRFGPEVAAAVTRVGTLAERSIFGPSDPPDAGEAAGSWRAQHEALRLARRRAGRSRRAQALLRVGPQPRRPSARPGRSLR